MKMKFFIGYNIVSYIYSKENCLEAPLFTKVALVYTCGVEISNFISRGQKFMKSFNHDHFILVFLDFIISLITIKLKKQNKERRNIIQISTTPSITCDVKVITIANCIL